MVETAPTGAREESAPREHLCEVFLCHNRLDSVLVREVAEALELEFGIPHFLDEYAIPAGEEFLPWIEKALGESSGCAVFLGANGWGRTHFWEAEKALARYRSDREFRLIPVLLRGARPEDMARLGAGFVFDRFNWVDLRDGAVDRMSVQRLRAALRGQMLEGTRGPAKLTPYLVRRDAARWAEGRDASVLYRGRELREAQQLSIASPDLTSGPNVAPFLAASARAQTNRARRFAVASGFTTLMLLVLTLLALREARVARSRELAALAAATDQRDRALLVAREAYRVMPTLEARGSLLRILNSLRHVQLFLHGHPAGVRALAISPSGDRVAAGGEGGRIVLWRLARPEQPIHVLGPFGERLHCLEFTHDGRRLLAGYERGGVRSWDLESGESVPIAGWPAPTAGTSRVSTDYDGADPEPPERRGERAVSQLALVSGGRAVAADAGARLFVIDVSHAVVTSRVQLDLYGIEALTSIREGTWAAVGDGGGRVCGVELSSGRVVPAASRPTNAGIVLLGEVEGGFVSLDGVGRLVTWKLSDRSLDVVREKALPIAPMHAELGPSGRLLVTTRFSDIRAFSLESGEELDEDVVRAHRLAPLALRCDAASGRCTSGGLGGEVAVFDLRDSHSLVDREAAVDLLVKALRYRASAEREPDVLAQRDHGFAWRPLGRGTWAGSRVVDGLTEVAVRDDSAEAFVSFFDGRILHYRNSAIGAGEPVPVKELPPGGYDVLRLSPGGRFLASVDRSRQLTVWSRDSSDGRYAASLSQKLTPIVSSLAFSPDERYFAIGHLTGQLSLYALDGGPRLVTTVDASRGPIFGLAFLKGSRELVTGSGAGDRSIRVHDVPTLDLVRTLPELHAQSLSSLAVSPDGGILASAADDGRLALWDTESWREIGSFPHGVDTLFQTVRFSPDGSRLATASDRHVWSWLLQDSDWLAAARRIANRELTPEERRQNVERSLLF